MKRFHEFEGYRMRVLWFDLESTEYFSWILSSIEIDFWPRWPSREHYRITEAEHIQHLLYTRSSVSRNVETCCRSFTSHLSRKGHDVLYSSVRRKWCCFHSLSFMIPYPFWKRSRRRRFQNRYNNETSFAIQDHKDRHLVMGIKDERRGSLTTSWASERTGPVAIPEAGEESSSFAVDVT